MELVAMAKRRHNHWTVEKEALLIQLYKDYRLLWDSRHPEYYKRDKRDKAMRAIAKALDNEFDGKIVDSPLCVLALSVDAPFVGGAQLHTWWMSIALWRCRKCCVMS